MRRIIQGSLLVVSLSLPAFAFSRETVGLNTNQVMPQQTQGTGNPQLDRPVRSHWTPVNTTVSDIGTLGNGPMNGNEPGHIDSPGGAKIDNDSRAPINDVQVGRGTEDVPQSANPPPAR